MENEFRSFSNLSQTASLLMRAANDTIAPWNSSLRVFLQLPPTTTNKVRSRQNFSAIHEQKCWSTSKKLFQWWKHFLNCRYCEIWNQTDLFYMKLTVFKKMKTSCPEMTKINKNLTTIKISRHFPWIHTITTINHNENLANSVTIIKEILSQVNLALVDWFHVYRAAYDRFIFWCIIPLSLGRHLLWFMNKIYFYI